MIISPQLENIYCIYVGVSLSIVDRLRNGSLDEEKDNNDSNSLATSVA